jgi:hypothetical protein
LRLSWQPGDEGAAEDDYFEGRRHSCCSANYWRKRKSGPQAAALP